MQNLKTVRVKFEKSTIQLNDCAVKVRSKGKNVTLHFKSKTGDGLQFCTSDLSISQILKQLTLFDMIILNDDNTLKFANFNSLN